MANKKIFLLDASSYVFRAYHAVTFLTNSKSFPTNAIYGFINMFNKLIKDFNPEYLVAVFDSGGTSFRNEIYEDYKANRGEAPEDISLQFPKIIEYLKLSGIKTIMLDNYEADDLIGSIAEKFKNNYKIFIISGDKDFVQLIDKNVNMIDTTKGKTTNVKGVVIIVDFLLHFRALPAKYNAEVPFETAKEYLDPKKLLIFFSNLLTAGP